MAGDSNLSGFDTSQTGPQGRTVWARTRRWLLKLVLSDSPKQRIVLIRSLTSMLIYAVALSMLQYSEHTGLIKDAYWVHWLQICIVAWIASVYLFLRSGLNWLLSDPSMTQFQILGANV